MGSCWSLKIRKLDSTFILLKFVKYGLRSPNTSETFEECSWKIIDHKNAFFRTKWLVECDIEKTHCENSSRKRVELLKSSV